MRLEPMIQSEVSQKEKHKYCILRHIHGIMNVNIDNPTWKAAKDTQM